MYWIIAESFENLLIHHERCIGNSLNRRLTLHPHPNQFPSPRKIVKEELTTTCFVISQTSIA